MTEDATRKTTLKTGGRSENYLRDLSGGGSKGEEKEDRAKLWFKSLSDLARKSSRGMGALWEMCRTEARREEKNSQGGKNGRTHDRRSAIIGGDVSRSTDP